LREIGVVKKWREEEEEEEEEEDEEVMESVEVAEDM